MKTSGARFSVMDREDMLNKIQTIKDTVDGRFTKYLFTYMVILLMKK